MPGFEQPVGTEEDGPGTETRLTSSLGKVLSEWHRDDYVAISRKEISAVIYHLTV